MENLDDILPYLNLRDGEELLFVKRFEGGIPIIWLAKYHEPEKFPEHLIKIKKDYYFFDQIDIITNFRLIKFGINYNYMEEDGITNISEIFHHENLFLWVNLEDIIDFEVDFSIIEGKGFMGFKFIGNGRLKVKERPLRFTSYNYEEYCQVKDIVIKLLNFGRQDIDKEEDKNIKKIIKKNKVIFRDMFIVLLILSFCIIALISPIDTQDPVGIFLLHPFIGVYMVYVLFFLLFNPITLLILVKKYKTKRFFTLMKRDFAWYLGPNLSAFFFVIMIGVLVLYGALSNSMDNKLVALSISVGSWTITVILIFVIAHFIEKRKENYENEKNH